MRTRWLVGATLTNPYPGDTPMKRLGLCVVAMAWMGVSARAQNPVTPLKANDRIVFLGDSITQAGAGPKG